MVATFYIRWMVVMEYVDFKSIIKHKSPAFDTMETSPSSDQGVLGLISGPLQNNYYAVGTA